MKQLKASQDFDDPNKFREEWDKSTSEK